MNGNNQIDNPEQISGLMKVKRLAEELRSESSPAYKQLNDEQYKAHWEKEAEKLMMATGVSSQGNIACAVDIKMRPFVIKFARQLIEEYNCKTSSEKSMAELAAIHYSHFLTFSEDALFYNKGINYQKLSDNASRQYMSALSMLRYLKAPQLSVNFVARNAFIAQNQQINSTGNQDKNS